MKKILITGKNSYIGQSFSSWLEQWPDDYQIEMISVRDDSWHDIDFSNYDTVLHLAGMAHVSTDPKMERIYYQVNRDLTIGLATKSRIDGVEQFIFMSSIIVYGAPNKGDKNSKKDIVGGQIGQTSMVLDESVLITLDTIPAPDNFYGQSKLGAEAGIRELETDGFKVAIIRPPMIYGKWSKGNYPRLAKLAQKTPIFPDYPNRRSMLHIDNLCEFIRLLVDNSDRGIYFPQNEKYVNTSNLVKEIAAAHGKKVYLTKLFNGLISRMLGIETVNKVFGDLVYDQSMSDYDKGNYRVRNFDESILLTELPE